MSSNNFFYDWFATAKEPVKRIITRAIDLKIISTTTKEINKFRAQKIRKKWNYFTMVFNLFLSFLNYFVFEMVIMAPDTSDI